MAEQQSQVGRDVRIPDQRVDRSGPAATTSATVPAPTASPTAGRAASVDVWQALPWRTVARISLSRSLLTWVLTLLVLAVLPLAVGWTPRVILSGSMEPSIRTGDVVVTRPVDGSQIAAGSVITTVDPDKPAQTRTHRMVERDDAGMVVTKGDANADADSTPVRDSDVLGAGILRVPFVGLPAHWLAVGQLAPLGLALAVLTGAVLGSFRPRTPRPADGSRRGGGTAGPGGPYRPERRVRARGRRARRAGAAVTLTMAATLVVAGAPTSYAAFSARTTGPSSSFAAGTQFYPYRDAVLTDGASLYWRLDERSGTAVADTAGSADATVRGGVTWGQVGALASETGSTAAALANGFVTSDSPASGAGRFSFETWVRTTTTQGGSLVTFGNGSGNSASSTEDRVLYLQPDGRVRFGVLGVGGFLGLQSARTTTVSASSVNDGAWHHVVGTYQPGTNGLKVYVDGRLESQTTASYTVQSRSGWFYRAGGENLSGWQGAPSAQTLTGQLDETAVYDGTTLTAEQVRSHVDIARGR